MSIFTTMRAGVSVIPPQTNRMPSMGEGSASSDSFSSLVNGRSLAPEDSASLRLSIYNAISADTRDYLSNSLTNRQGDLTNELPSGGSERDDEVTNKPGEEVTNELLAGSSGGSSDGVSNDLPRVDVPDDEVGSPIGEGTVTNERPLVQV